ncbi:MAG TPA: SGNH/GDSL hydrolase family protein [Streptosporangiaceae bacterium]|jgi:lysophospholipase L1-like esterase|nr:SGNH/GDSL hydrolase family protein [Streptosporangiaceae bacterium]
MEAGEVGVDVGSFVALGDSFTEGLDDPRADQQGYRGWADRFAELLAERRPGLRYANLAVRGKKLAEVAEEQVPQAIAMAPDLVSLAAGGNDMLRPRADPDALAETYDEVVRTLLMAGCPVLMFTGFDPRFPVLRLIRGKVAAFNMHLRAIADRHHCYVVDLWSMDVLRDPRAWSADRLHLTPDAHRRVALRACEVLGVPVAADWREPWPAADGIAVSPATAWITARRMDMRWARVHAAPWVARRVRGVSSGDDVAPKRPELLPW